MEREKAIVLLKEWVARDRLMRNYSTESDYDKFCEERNVAIDTVLAELKKVNKSDTSKEKAHMNLYNDMKNNYIHKDKIREKIKELESKLFSQENQDGEYIYDSLQELLESGE